MYKNKYIALSARFISVFAACLLFCCACTKSADNIAADHSSTAASTDSEPVAFIDITEQVATDGRALLWAQMDESGNIWAMLKESDDNCCTLVSYSCSTQNKRTVHPFASSAAEVPRLLSVSPAVVYSPDEALLYIFGEGKNMQVVDLQGQNISAPCFCKESMSLYWTDPDTDITYKLGISETEPAPAFTTLLEYGSCTVEKVFSNGSAVVSGVSLKDLEQKKVLAAEETGLIGELGGSNCCYGCIDGAFVKAEYTGRDISFTLADAVYKASLKGDILACTITDSGDFLVLCSDGKAQQLVRYSVTEDALYFTGCGSANISGEIEKMQLAGTQTSDGKSSAVLTLCTLNDGSQRLHLWLIDDLQPVALEGTGCNAAKQAAAVSSWADALAQSIEQTYGVQILMGDDAVLAFPDYETDPLYDEDRVIRALNQLEKALSLYPEGYFKALSDGFIRGIVFCITGEMRPTNPVNISDPDGFAVMYYNTQLIAINGLTNSDICGSICHEITHATDKKIAAAAENGDVDFSEKGWQQLNPPGFEYYNSYLDKNGSSYSYTGSPEWTGFWMDNDIEDVYFVDSYSKTYPTEDRARLMEVVMTSQNMPEYIYSENIQAKLRYYFAAIRQVLGADWDSPPYWERALNQPA